MIRVLIESPFGAASSLAEEEYKIVVDKNLDYLRAAMNDCFKRGEAPFASHGLYTQDGVLNDKVPDERKLGIEAGLLWGQMAAKTVVYTDRGISGGMKQGIDRAIKDNRPIEIRSLGGDWVSYTNAPETMAYLGELVTRLAARKEPDSMKLLAEQLAEASKKPPAPGTSWPKLPVYGPGIR